MKKEVFLAMVLTVFCLPGQVCFAAEGVSATTSATYFQRFFVDGGPLVWFVLLPLSVVTVSLIVQHFLSIRRVKLMPPDTIAGAKRLLEKDDAAATLDFLHGRDSFLSRTLMVGLAERRNGRVAVENAIAEMLEQESTGLLRKIEWLNIIGNVAPMIGLFGTVWGMIEAFDRIVYAHGQPEPDQLAGAISIALVTTFWGLFAAIPALTAHGALRNRIDALSAEIALAAEDILRKK